MIYGEMFQTLCGGNVINPDPTYFRRRGKGDLAARTINNGSGLLRTCQQAHNEGAAVLYSSHVFCFDDTKYGTLMSELDPKECRKDGITQRVLEACMLPRCDYIFMFDWLVTIGHQNRLMIRHLELHFTHPTFAATKTSLWTMENPGVKGGVFVRRALQLFASAHHLETISLSFQLPADRRGREDGMWEISAFLSFFLPESIRGLTNDLKSALSSIKGIKRMYCADLFLSDYCKDFAGDPKVVDAANASLWEVRRLMESGYTPHDDQILSIFKTATYVDQVERSMRDWENEQIAGSESHRETPVKR
jgi:hypothetical protein